jgi:hypothetical protein
MKWRCPAFCVQSIPVLPVISNHSEINRWYDWPSRYVKSRSIYEPVDQAHESSSGHEHTTHAS